MTEEDYRGRAIDVEAEVSYADGAVVSKTLMDKPHGTLTLFSFDAGQGLSEHTSPYDATVMVLDGEAAVTVDGDMKIVKTGEMIIMPCDIPHSLKAEQKFKMLLIMIK